MDLLVYVTKQCASDAEVHGLQKEVGRFKERVEQTQSTSQFDPFPPPYIVKKKLGGRQGRLIAERRQVRDHAVIIFLAIMIRGDSEYDEFARDPKEYGEQHFAGLVSEEAIDQFLKERTRVAVEPPKPEPSASEYGFLFSAFAHHQGSSAEDLVCESKHWVESVGENRIANQLALFCKPCLSALSLDPGLHFVEVDGKPEWGIWVLRTESRLLLIVPSTDRTIREAEARARELAGRLEGRDPEAILRESHRAYPALVLADDELWLDLERDPHANMALSPEESDVLESARRNNDPFPLFISGRAGSGKSTILQYLFADLLFYYLNGKDTGTMAPPIPVVWFRANDAAFWESFRKHSGFVVIVPCNEGEEREFVEADPVLREHIEIEEGVPINVLSAARAKGREYPAVLVYGFGAQADFDVASALTEGKDAVPNPDRSLPRQFFVNRLYVAVSRPKTRLVIVDTDAGLSRLWESFRDEVAEKNVLDQIRRGPEIWGGYIEGMIVGKPDQITRENAVDPLENARAFESDGRARRDAFLLKQAAQAYRSGGDNAKAGECRARAMEAEGDLLAAGDAYFDTGFVDDGVRCLWRSRRSGWERLCEHLQQFPQIAKEIEFQWAKTVTQDSRPDEIVKVVEGFAHRLEDRGFAATCIGDPFWRDAIDALLEPLFDENGQPVARDHLQRMAGNLDRIKVEGIKLPLRPSAYVFYLAGRYAEAVALWEESGDTKHQEYFRAKASIEPSRSVFRLWIG